MAESGVIYFACQTPFRRPTRCRLAGCGRAPLRAMGRPCSQQRGRRAPTRTRRAPTSPGRRANTAPGAKPAKAQLRRDLAPRDRNTALTCPAARAAPEREAPSPARLLHHGEHSPARELTAVLLRRCHGKATLGSRSETPPLSDSVKWKRPVHPFYLHAAEGEQHLQEKSQAVTGSVCPPPCAGC